MSLALYLFQTEYTTSSIVRSFTCTQVTLLQNSIMHALREIGCMYVCMREFTRIANCALYVYHKLISLLHTIYRRMSTWLTNALCVFVSLFSKISSSSCRLALPSCLSISNITSSIPTVPIRKVHTTIRTTITSIYTCVALICKVGSS
jgi:hypothetical protein